MAATHTREDSRWTKVGRYLLDLLYPPHCGGCDTLGVWLCEGCRSRVMLTPNPGWRCALCLARLEMRGGRLQCLAGCETAGLKARLAFGAYTKPLSEAVHQLKYSGWRGLAPELAALLIIALRDAGDTFPWPTSAKPYLLPVPLHRRRQRERGFNQSALLAAEISTAFAWPLATGLARVKDTPRQVGSSKAERARNMKDAFAWRAETQPPATIVLLDDVYTTGETTDACVAALKAAGAAQIYAITLLDNSGPALSLVT